MSASNEKSQGQTAENFGLGGSEMGKLIRAMDWSRTPLGPMESWSSALRMMVQFLLPNRFPLLLWWGPQYVSIYNDAYRPVLGAKHPWALGKPVSECWSEIWHILQPLIDTPFKGGPATWNDDICLEINRYGFVEETHFTIAYSPVPDETVAGGIGGVLATVHEISEKVVAERRVVALRDLGARIGDAKTATEACTIAAQTLAAHNKDVPFALLYLIENDTAHLAGAAGVAMGADISPTTVDLRETHPGSWPFAEVINSNSMRLLHNLSARFNTIPPGPWSDAPDTAVVLPIPSNKPNEPAGVMVAAVSARLRFDEYYRDFLELVRNQIATSIANARAYEEERKRAEALAELDREKTAFFSNVSHEFRTPITLMLGPLEDTLDSGNSLAAEDRERLEVAHRNSLRLLKLVNTLLDFSRIEAGRIQASYEPTDLAGFTAELSSIFRSAIERAGLKLILNCAPIAEPVYVDREMWEKIVLNLLSNAFKFTFAGEIEVSVQQAHQKVEITVRDTGTGIPAEEIPHLFERFHRVKGSRGRTFEGSGIGLALVQELVRLHGGTVQVESELDHGTTFRVSIPLGKAHLPADRIGAARTAASTGLRAEAYVEEALHWLPDNKSNEHRDGLGSTTESEDSSSPRSNRPRILLADDNADMRDYVRGLLDQRYEVEAVADGLAALTAARDRAPDLVLTDAMMPGMDGFALLRQLRSDPVTATVPVIMLSARAGEEARVEGVGAGADDYLVKPFSARELLARVGTHIELARVRQEAAAAMLESERKYRMFADTAPAILWVTDPDGSCSFLSRGWYEFTGQTETEALGFGWLNAVHPDDRASTSSIFLAANARHEQFAIEYRLRTTNGDYRWTIDSGRPRSGDDGAFLGYTGSVIDIHERKLAEQALLQSEERLKLFIHYAPAGIAMLDREMRYLAVSQRFLQDYRFTETDVIGRSHYEVFPDVPERWRDFHQRALRGEILQAKEDKFEREDGSIQWLHWEIHPWRDATGEVGGILIFAEEITRRKQAEEERERLLAREMQSRQKAEEASRLKDEFLANVSHELRTPLNAVLGWAQILRRNPQGDQAAKAVETIERNARAQNQLINDLLDVSRIITGRLRLDVRPVDPVTPIEAAIEALRPAAEAKGVRVQRVMDTGIGVISGDADRLQQIIWNILSNAIKFTPRGGRIQVRLERVNSHVEITISDTGIGIRPEFLPFVFDRFRQDDGSTARTHGGLGLGLAIVRHLVELHGGEIRANSPGENQGATFTVKLPLVAVYQRGIEQREELLPGDSLAQLEYSQSLLGVKVLVVDDELDTCELLRTMIEKCGAEVSVANSARSALEKIEQEPFDLVVSDIGMPGADGYELIQTIRSRPPDRGGKIPAIALTAYARTEDRLHALRSGYQMHVPKPIEFAELVTVMATLASRHS